MVLSGNACLYDYYDAGDDTLYCTNDANTRLPLPVADRPGGQVNVTALVNTSGTVVERYMYDAYGKVTVLDADWSADADGKSDYDNEILFCGYRYDPETGLYYVRFRYYHPTLGRWVSRDPIGYADGINAYQYAQGSPLSLLDPLGLMSNAQRILQLLVKLKEWDRSMEEVIMANCWCSRLPKKKPNNPKLKSYKKKIKAYNEAYSKCLKNACAKKSGHRSDKEKGLFVWCTTKQAIKDLANFIAGRNALGKMNKAGESLRNAKGKIDEIRKVVEEYERLSRVGTRKMTPQEKRTLLLKIGPMLGKLDVPHALGAQFKQFTEGDIMKNVKGLKADQLGKLVGALDKVNTVLNTITTAYDYLQNPDQLASTMMASNLLLEGASYLPQAAYMKGYYRELNKRLMKQGFKDLSKIQFSTGKTNLDCWKNLGMGRDSGFMSHTWAVEYWKIRDKGAVRALFNKTVSMGGGGRRTIRGIKIP